jgi:hypothetical protein
VDVEECKRLFLAMDSEFLDESTLLTFQKFCGDAKEDVCMGRNCPIPVELHRSSARAKTWYFFCTFFNC